MPIKRHDESEFEEAVASDNAKRRTARDSISRLPATICDEISRSLADHKTWRYVAKICERVGLKGITAQNVTNYRNGRTHGAWLAKQDRIEAIRADQAEGREIFEAARADGMNPADAACAVLARKMLGVAQGVDLEIIDEAARMEPKLYIQFIKAATALAKTLKPARQAQPAREASAQDAPKGGGLSEEEKTRKMKEFFGAQ
jgi:hypothetical protein